jgi:hypothetical protein
MADKKKKPMTDKQRQARLENLKKANGPKTPEGKAKSAQNAIKSGYWARVLRAVDRGPLREDPNELQEFIDAYFTELDPGNSVICRQAALDVADKAWRLTRAQRWEAEGYSGADYRTMEAASAAQLRFRAGLYRRQAEAVRGLPDPAASDDDLEGALCSLSFAVGMSEEDLDWIEDADRTEMVEGLATLISSHFADQEDAASQLDKRAADDDEHAGVVENTWRPGIIREELEGFARTAERMISHASRELDRALRRYDALVDRFGDTGDIEDEDDEPEPGEADDPAQPDDQEPNPDGGADGAADKFDIWSFMTADEVVDYLSNLDTSNTPGGPSRNEPTERSPAM